MRYQQNKDKIIQTQWGKIITPPPYTLFSMLSAGLIMFGFFWLYSKNYMKYPRIGKGTIRKIEHKDSVILLYYSFSDGDINYCNYRKISESTIIWDDLLNKELPVAYEMYEPENNTLLLTKMDFEHCHEYQPDSLKKFNHLDD